MIKSELQRKEIEVQTEINYKNNSNLSNDLLKDEDFNSENAEEKDEKKNQDTLINDESENSNKPQNFKNIEENPFKALNNNEIERIMLFYKNKTFIEYKPG